MKLVNNEVVKMLSLATPIQPALAVADIVCGAVLAAYSGEDRYRKVIEHKLTERVVSA